MASKPAAVGSVLIALAHVLTHRSLKCWCQGRLAAALIKRTGPNPFPSAEVRGTAVCFELFLGCVVIFEEEVVGYIEARSRHRGSYRSQDACLRARGARDVARLDRQVCVEVAKRVRRRVPEVCRGVHLLHQAFVRHRWAQEEVCD